MTACLVRGSGDIGSAVAHALFMAGHSVAMHDLAAPTCARRGMAFVDALFDGHARLEGVEAFRVREPRELLQLASERRGIGISATPFARVLEALEPEVLVDARMRKREVPEGQRGLAPLVIGMGPNFTAGDNCDLVVETAWGPTLGAVIARGASRPFGGEPRSVAGHRRERFVYASVAGRVRAGLAIGARVQHGQLLGSVAGEPIVAPLDGILAGLTRDGVDVRCAAKVAEVDPRGDPRLAFLIGERAAAVAAGVLRALREADLGQAAPFASIARAEQPRPLGVRE